MKVELKRRKLMKIDSTKLINYVDHLNNFTLKQHFVAQVI